MLSGPRESSESGEFELASSPWEWGVVVDAADHERDTIPAPAPAEGDEDDVFLERS